MAVKGRTTINLAITFTATLAPLGGADTWAMKGPMVRVATLTLQSVQAAVFTAMVAAAGTDEASSKAPKAALATLAALEEAALAAAPTVVAVAEGTLVEAPHNGLTLVLEEARTTRALTKATTTQATALRVLKLQGSRRQQCQSTLQDQALQVLTRSPERR